MIALRAVRGEKETVSTNSTGSLVTTEKDGDFHE